VARSIAQIRRALSGLAFNLTDLEDHLDLTDVDRHVDALETLVEQAQEDKEEADDSSDDDSDDEEEASDSDE